MLLHRLIDESMPPWNGLTKNRCIYIALMVTRCDIAPCEQPSQTVLSVKTLNCTAFIYSYVVQGNLGSQPRRRNIQARAIQVLASRTSSTAGHQPFHINTLRPFELSSLPPHPKKQCLVNLDLVAEADHPARWPLRDQRLSKLVLLLLQHTLPQELNRPAHPPLLHNNRALPAQVFSDRWPAPLRMSRVFQCNSEKVG